MSRIIAEQEVQQESQFWISTNVLELPYFSKNLGL